MQSLFADGITNLAITGQLIRIDFGTAAPVTAAEGKQGLDHRLVQNGVFR